MHILLWAAGIMVGLWLAFCGTVAFMLREYWSKSTATGFLMLPLLPVVWIYFMLKGGGWKKSRDRELELIRSLPKEEQDTLHNVMRGKSP